MTENDVTENASWKPHLDMGVALRYAGDTQRAAESLRQAIDIAPGEPYPHYELGHTLFQEGRYEEALQELKAADDLTEGFLLVQTDIYVCECIMAGKLNEGALEVLRALQQLTDTGSAQSEDAVILSRRAVELAPSCALGYFHLGKALIQSRPSIAEKALQHCLGLVPDDTTAINVKLHLGLIRQASGDRDAARYIWQTTLYEYEGNPQTRMCEVMVDQLSARDEQGGAEDGEGEE